MTKATNKKIDMPAWHVNYVRLAASVKPGEMDYRIVTHAAACMKEQDLDSLRSLIIDSSDTASREHILAFIHPAHWVSLGTSAVNMRISTKVYQENFDDRPSESTEEAESRKISFGW